MEPLADLAVFRSAPDLAMLMVPRSSHMHDFAPTRHRVWARLESFVEQVLTQRRLAAGDA